MADARFSVNIITPKMPPKRALNVTKRHQIDTKMPVDSHPIEHHIHNSSHQNETKQNSS